MYLLTFNYLPLTCVLCILLYNLSIAKVNHLLLKYRWKSYQTRIFSLVRFSKHCETASTL